MNPYCSAFSIGSEWALSIPIGSITDKKDRDPIAIHYVVDNSGSMGANTRLVQEIFSEMVDSVATAPCSFTVFHNSGEIISSDIKTGQQMRDLELPPQGMTNIPAGIQKALGNIYGQEMKRLKSKNRRIHHILILLSDGKHNTGDTPDKVFPTLGDTLPDDTKLSVIVVGFSQHSSTSMGMLLKKNIETITFQADNVQTIYFATTRTALKSALASLESGLNMALDGSFYEIQTHARSIVHDFASEPEDNIRIHAAPGSTSINVLCSFEKIPETIKVDGKELPITAIEAVIGSFLPSIPFESLSDLIQGLIHRTRVRIVAAKAHTSRQVIAKSVKRLEALYNILEDRRETEVTTDLQSLSAKERVEQFRTMRRLGNKAAELKNQILDIANFSNSASSSENQASFLNGRSMKFANKALRRAAKKRGEDGIIMDPKVEQKNVQKWLTSTKFINELQDAMNADVIENTKRLSDKQIQSMILPAVEKRRHIDFIWEIRRKAACRDTEALSQGAQNFVNSGKLAEYLNDSCHGKRRSFISMSTPWQHLEEWKSFGNQKFESFWEMLMYGGLVGYPITLERSAACQMNPFLINVNGVRSSIVDTASACCANQADIPVYGPEGGEPVRDVLVLVDPSMPSSSKMIFNSKLLGEKFTSATIARDLQMYTGAAMKIALHTNSLWYLVTTPEQITEDDEVANLQRTFLDRAFQCPMCGFGPVDHYACGDLHSHHGRSVNNNVKVSNACPNCDWFSPYIESWKPWDGTVPDSFLESLRENQKNSIRQYLSEATVDLILRVVYSFRKLSNDSTRQEYAEKMDLMMDPLSNDGGFDFSTKAGVAGLAQLVMALFASDDCKKAKIILNSQSCLKALIQEDCARHARTKFRQEADGQKEMARQRAMDYITKLLGISSDDNNIPHTAPQMESEPPIENIRQDCSGEYSLDSVMAAGAVQRVRDIAKHWCRVWSFAKAFVSIISSRGGWKELEQDMETSEWNYKDIVQKLKSSTLLHPKNLLLARRNEDDLSQLKSFFLQTAVSSILSGAADLPLLSEEDEDNDIDSGDIIILQDAAREMRMRFYMQRVAEKMTIWKQEGQQTTFLRARATDIVQFGKLVSSNRHVHGLEKNTFWGLWLAAVDSKEREKIVGFLSTANEGFIHKHGCGWGSSAVQQF